MHDHDRLTAGMGSALYRTWYHPVQPAAQEASHPMNPVVLIESTFPGS